MQELRGGAVTEIGVYHPLSGVHNISAGGLSKQALTERSVDDISDATGRRDSLSRRATVTLRPGHHVSADPLPFTVVAESTQNQIPRDTSSQYQCSSD